MKGVESGHFDRALERQPPRWRVMRRHAGVYIRGRVRHANHKTITRHCWNRVLMNTESQARAMRQVSFLD